MKLVKQNTEQKLSDLLFIAKRLEVTTIQELPPSGSYRKYFRLFCGLQTFIGAFNPEPKENLAFIHFSKHFINCGLKVPEIIAEDIDNHIYIHTDLGDTTLFSFLEQNRKKQIFPENAINIYKQVLIDLIKFQFEAGKELDYSFCYPRESFDRQSMMWDLNYFKYYFLKLAKVNFDEQKLENDFEVFVNYLLKADCIYFLYRDFQSRNIMLKNNIVYYIDYQGGRRGPLYYDAASLLYDAKANIPQNVREELLDYYINLVKKIIYVDELEFRSMYYGYVLIRIMQAMGAYGFRGFYEKKEHFLRSIPYALQNLDWLLNNLKIPVKIPTLIRVLEHLTVSEELMKYNEKIFPESSLCVHIQSFSYLKGLPIDKSGHGGGFIFDCRVLPNPGKYSEYENNNGKDSVVKDFLDNDEEVKQFLQNVYKIVEQSVEKYISRNFTHLQIAFGCTGGQHRSVFCAEKLAAHLKLKYQINIELEHTNKNNWKK
ncbi:MAG: phosphotransferase enzyme family protein [Bacteroidetes bacterium CG23_combo_of_CG06-09_8_20_14_all_32_9]|nr:MAG: phosphotransferase enzyme family protein [Bacteroidetes bacterium CG23_combo_of_CG06-09_8_20_14_all_32_9]